MIPTYEQVGAIVCSVLLVVSALGLGGVGSVAASDHSQNTTQVDVDPSDLAGSGTEADPYQITNASELQAMEDDLDAHYELTSNINASTTHQWNDGKGFNPVGTFSGSFDGNNHTVNGLVINRSEESRTGLFSASEGVLANVSLTEVEITGSSDVGGLAGINRGGTIKSSTVSGSVSDSSNGFGGDVGGLVGQNDQNATIRNASATADISGVRDAGGLVGRNIAKIVDSHATGEVEGRSDSSLRRPGNRVGGLSGYNQGTIIRSYAAGTVTGDSRVGGLVGVNFDYNGTKTVVRRSYATGDVIGEGRAVGGLVGSNFEGAAVGDLVPSLDVRVTNSYAAGDVFGGNDVGGLVGFNNGTIAQSFATGTIAGAGNKIGGLVGENFEQVENSYWDTQATGQSTSAGSATGLTTTEMEGQAAQMNMDGLEFTNVWVTTESYPELRNVSASSDQGNDDSTGLIIAPGDGSYKSDEPLTIGTAHIVTGNVDSSGVAIRLVNATGDNETIVAQNNDAPVAGQVNTTIPAGSLSGNVTIETQLYDRSTQRVVATDTINLTADTSDNQDDIVSQYDVDSDGVETSELLTGISDWRSGEIGTPELLTLIDAWRSNSST